MSLLVFILFCYGCTQILIHGSIFNKVRPNYKFFKCPMCVGFWVGALGLFLFPALAAGTATNAFIYGCLSSGATYVLSMLVDDFGLKINRRQ